MAGAILIFMMAVIPTAQAQTFTVLHEFTCGPDGCLPQAGLSMDRVGNYYGTASSGGASNLGTVYQLSHHNSSWIVTPLYNFKGGSDDGRNPWSRVIVWNRTEHFTARRLTEATRLAQATTAALCIASLHP